MTTATKLKLYAMASKAKQTADKACIAGLGAVTTVLGSAGIVSSAETPVVSAPTIDLSGVDFSGLVTSITSVVPQVLPVAVACCGIRKAISFIMSTIRGC